MKLISEFVSFNCWLIIGISINYDGFVFCSEPWCSNVESKSGGFSSEEATHQSPRRLLKSLDSFSTIHCGIACRKVNCEQFQFDEDSGKCHMYSGEVQTASATHDPHLPVFSDDTKYTAFMGTHVSNHCMDGSSCSLIPVNRDCYDVMAGPTPWKCGSSEATACVCAATTSLKDACPYPDSSTPVMLYTGSLSQTQNTNIPKLFTVDAVEFHGNTYIAASMIDGFANETHPRIYKYSADQLEYVLHQTLPASGDSRDSRFFVLGEELYLWQPIHYDNDTGSYITNSIVHKLNVDTDNFEHYQGISSNGVFGGCAGRRSNGDFWLAESYYTGLGTYYSFLYTYKWDPHARQFGPNLPTTRWMKEPWGCEFDEIDGEWYVFGSSTRGGGVGSAAVFKLDDVTGAWTILRQYGSPMYDMHPLSYKGVHYLVTGSSARIVLNRFDTATKSYENLQAIILNIKVCDIDSFVYGGDLFVIAAVEGENVPSKIYRLDLDQDKLVHFLDTQPMNSVHKNVPFKRNGKQYIVSATSQGQNAADASMIIHQFIIN